MGACVRACATPHVWCRVSRLLRARAEALEDVRPHVTAARQWIRRRLSDAMCAFSRVGFLVAKCAWPGEELSACGYLGERFGMFKSPLVIAGTIDLYRGTGVCEETTIPK